MKKFMQWWQFFRRSPVGVVGFVIVVGYVMMAIFGPMFVHFSVAQNLSQADLPPSWHHWLGTDFAGRGILSDLIYGSRPVLMVAFIAACGGVIVGTLIGLVSGFSMGIIDAVLMRTADFFLTIPTLPLVIVVTAVIHSANPLVLAAILALTSWAGLSRAIRAQTLSLAQREFMESARILDLSLPRIVLKELLPNLSSYVTMNFLLMVIGALYAEIGLYLLGVAPFSGTNWGIMLNIAMTQSGALYTTQSLWYLLSPMVTIVLLQLGLIMFSQGLDEVFNPRLRTY